MATSASSSPVALAKANNTFALNLLKKLGEEDKKANVLCSPLSITAALAMVMWGARGCTAAEMAKVLGFIERDQPMAEGDQPKVEGDQSKAEGDQPKAEGDQPKAEGDQPKAEGDQPMEQVQEKMRTQMTNPIKSQLQTRQQIKEQQQQTCRLPDYLVKCLKPQNGEDEVHAKLGQLLKSLKKEDDDYTISLANRLYGEKTYKFKDKYLCDIKRLYRAELEFVDFKEEAEDARVKINKWVDDETKGKIKELLQEGVVDDFTRLVLVNAIYFKGKWTQKFEESETVEGEFTTAPNETKKVKMMRQKSNFPLKYVPEVSAQTLEMPYVGKEISMIILLPDDSTGVDMLEKTLTPKKLVEWTKNMETVEVVLKLPRFSLEESYNLKEVLKKMGMVKAFSNSSNFSGMSSANNLVLSTVVHKANMEVTEEGTEASAGTGAVVSERSAPQQFSADHPFLFFIKHVPSRSILFAGRFCNPE